VALLVAAGVIVPSAVAYSVMRGSEREGAAIEAARREAALDSAAATPPAAAVAAAPDSADAPPPPPPPPRPVTSREVRLAAREASGFRLVVSLKERRLWVLDGRDTVRIAPVGIGMDSTLVYRGRVWRFRTPPGVRRVLGKESEPVWVPPEWHYVEVAHARGLELVTLRANKPVTLPDSTQILVQDGDVGIIQPGEPFRPFATDEEIIWEGKLYVPPLGTRQRQITGELGRFRLDLGDGYLLHGTPHTESIGEPSSHGCIRIGDDDIAWLYENVPVGTRVFTY
jgi:lipoprotein-anchoring transpeptidase ErfK/SrfK